jgi:hypothetical protein
LLEKNLKKNDTISSTKSFVGNKNGKTLQWKLKEENTNELRKGRGVLERDCWTGTLKGKEAEEDQEKLEREHLRTKL